MPKPTVAVHKFSSCDGCQLAFLNLGEDLLALNEIVEIRHFAEAGPMAMDGSVDVAFVEGSISTPEDIERIKHIRSNSNYLITIGACATSGGLQALRKMANASEWIAGIYASPEYINTLDQSTAISSQVKVDLELWGCPVNSRQIVAAIRALLFGVAPVIENEKVCLECKRHNSVCVMVTRNEPCMGPVTNTGCGSLCPSFGRACYACYGPAENTNTTALAHRLSGLGLTDDEVARRFCFIHSGAEVFQKEGSRWSNRS
jgi:coenzyme F420-reducing hydrogenase gamma subunit